MKTGPDQKYPLNEDPGQFGLGPKVRYPGSEMNQLRQMAATRAMEAGPDAPMPNPERALPPPHPPAPTGVTPDEGTPAPEPKGTFIYHAEGDPYEYQLNPDASVTIKSGPSGEGMKLTTGPAYQAVMGQIASGQLKPKAPEVRTLAGDIPENPVASMDDAEKQRLGYEDPRTETPRLLGKNP